MIIDFTLNSFHAYSQEEQMKEVYEMFKPYAGNGILESITDPSESQRMHVILSTPPDVVRIMENTLHNVAERPLCKDYGIVEVRIVLEDCGSEVEKFQSKAVAEYICANKDFPPITMYPNYKGEITFRWKFTVDYRDFCNIINSYVVRF